MALQSLIELEFVVLTTAVQVLLLITSPASDGIRVRCELSTHLSVGLVICFSLGKFGIRVRNVRLGDLLPTSRGKSLLP